MLATIGQQLEQALTGRLPADVRHNLRIETGASIAYGIFYAIAISFMPVVLRANIAIAIVVPFSYIWAFNAWTLLPAFIAHGIISAGMDLGVLSTGIELATPARASRWLFLGRKL